MSITATDTDFIAGNTAKYYVQQQITTTLMDRGARGQSTTIVDMGCGDASKWGWLAKQAGNIPFTFVGFDPDAAAIRNARARFPNWRFIAAPAYALKAEVEAADVIVSFSALEHVYQRREFIGAARTIMTKGGTFYLNYDNGHFLGRGEWKRNTFGPILARFGVERYFQAFVGQEEIEAILHECQFRIVREINFHQASSKEFQRVFAGQPAMRSYMDAWLDFDLKVNTLLQDEPEALRKANSNKYHLSKLFVLDAGAVRPA
jgi:SAM-dependent methyltransferase